MKLFLTCAALLSLSFCLAEDFVCPKDVNGDCIEVRYAHPDCSKYWRCFTEGELCNAYALDCPVGLHFSPPHQECIDPEDAGCIDTTTTSTITEATTEATTTTPTTTTTPPPGPDDTSAFSAGRSTDWNGGGGDVSFDEIGVNLGGCFKDGTTFQPDRDGVYFISFSAGTPAKTPVDIQVRPTNFPSTIYRESTTPEDIDMMYRSFLAEMDAADSLTYRSSNELTSSISLQTSFSGFSLTDMFEDVQAFFVSREEPFDVQERMLMPTVHLDLGDNYNMSGREFIAPQDGVYYFFFGAGQEQGLDNRVALRSWENELPETEAELWVHSTSHNGLDMATRGTMLELYAGQHVWVSLLENSVHSDAANSQVYFGGFFYNPAHGPAVAFAIHRTRSWQSALPLDPVPFEEIEVNQGDAFDADSNTVIIPTSGYYYIELSIGTLPERPLDVEMLLNGEPTNPGDLGLPIAHIIVASSNHSHVASTGRSVIAHLEQNDVLRLRAVGETGIFSDLDKQTTWMGFLLYED